MVPPSGLCQSADRYLVYEVTSSMLGPKPGLTVPPSLSALSRFRTSTNIFAIEHYPNPCSFDLVFW